MPPQKIPFANQFASPYALPQPQIPSIRGLRDVLGKELGVEPNSRIDNTLGGLEEVVPTLPSGTDIWHSLSKAQSPQQTPYSREAAVQSGSIVPLSQSPYGQQAATPLDATSASVNDPLKGGKMSFAGGASPNLSGTPGALDNFAALSKQFTPQRAASTEELYKAKYADPDTRSPGAAAWANDQLGEIPGTSEQLGIEKMRQPVQTAGIAAQGGIEQQRLAGQAQRDVAGIQGQTARDTNPFAQFLKGGQQLPNNLRGVSKSGFTLGPEQQIPQGAMSALTNAMYAAAQNPTVGMFNKQPSPASQALNSAISNIMSFVPNSDQISGFTDEVVNMPEYAKMQWNEILQATGETDLTSEEQLVFRALLQSKRGF